MKVPVSGDVKEETEEENVEQEENQEAKVSKKELT
jgi:hypothetical protein